MEFRENIKLPPSLLYIEDLKELESIILDSGGNENYTLEIEASLKEKFIKCKSINELLNTKDLFDSTDRLFFKTSDVIVDLNSEFESEVDRSVGVNMSSRYIYLYIQSKNEDWYNAKKSRIINFFNNKKPWYAIINKIAIIFPLISMSLFLYFIFLIKNGIYLFSAIPLLFSVFFAAISILTSKQLLFPYTKIVFQKKNIKKLDFNKLIVLLGIIQIIMVLIQIILSKQIK